MNISILDRPLRLSINPNLINKNEADDKRLFAIGWENHRLTPTQLAEFVDRGIAFTCELAGSRKRDNFVCAELLAVDIDGGMSVEDALADTIIIDESEQVLAHFLSGTIDKKRERIFKLFVQLLRTAKRVIALDADLGWLTFITLCELSDATVLGGERKTSTLIINERQLDSQVDIYSSKSQLIGELKKTIQEGRRVFVASNSKSFLTDLHEGLAKEFGSTWKRILITSDTTARDDVKSFIKNASEQALAYDAMFVSPTLGTGVDITFPGDESMIDVVFGFFEANITTHFDCDQQLWRVRHPRAVKVWISPQRFSFDTAPDVVRREILEKNLFKNALVGYDAENRAQYLTNDPLVDLAVLVRSRELASKNNLKHNFIEMKRRAGHIVYYVEKDSRTRRHWPNAKTRQREGFARPIAFYLFPD